VPLTEFYVKQIIYVGLSENLIRYSVNSAFQIRFIDHNDIYFLHEKLFRKEMDKVPFQIYVKSRLY